MEKRPFGKTGFDVSVLGFGAAPSAYLNTEGSDAAKLVNALLDAGINLVDTAHSYPGSHEFIGKHLSARRKDFVLVSKCGQKVEGVDASPWSPEAITAAIDRALRLMKTDRIDVMLLHSCDLKILKAGEAMAALVKAREAGKIRFAGYSGDNEAVAYAITLPDVAVVETSINIVDQKNIDMALPGARSNNVGVLAKRPIANAAWKDLSTQPGMYKNYAATYTERLGKTKIKPTLVGFKDDSADSWVEMALRFTLSQPGVTTAIVGTTNEQNARKNLAFAAKGPLPADAVEKIRAAYRGADPQGQWTGQT